MEVVRLDVRYCYRSPRLHRGLFQHNNILVAEYVKGEIEDEVLGGNKQTQTEVVDYRQRALLSVFSFY